MKIRLTRLFSDIFLDISQQPHKPPNAMRRMIVKNPLTRCRVPSGAVIFFRVSVFVTKKHLTIILRRMIVKCFFVTKTLTRKKITAPEGTRHRVRGFLTIILRIALGGLWGCWLISRKISEKSLVSRIFIRPPLIHY